MIQRIAGPIRFLLSICRGLGSIVLLLICGHALGDFTVADFDSEVAANAKVTDSEFDFDLQNTLQSTTP